MKTGILDYVSVALVVLKLTGVIAWTWAQVLCLPLILLSWGVFEAIMEMLYESTQKKKEELE